MEHSLLNLLDEMGKVLVETSLMPDWTRKVPVGNGLLPDWDSFTFEETAGRGGCGAAGHFPRQFAVRTASIYGVDLEPERCFVLVHVEMTLVHVRTFLVHVKTGLVHVRIDLVHVETGLVHISLTCSPV